MILEEFALIASDTARTKAYLNAMLQENKLPKMCVVYSENISKMQEDAQQYKKGNTIIQYFDFSRPVLSYIQEAGISYVLVENRDINSEQMKNIIQTLDQKYLIYSGYGGYILKPHLFQLGKNFVHIHAGILPKYRGSTTAYYSFLQERSFGATAILMSEGIDEGDIIVHNIFGIPDEPVDIDNIYEPYMRSRVLMKAIDKYIAEGELTATSQSMEDTETYFIIHPVLKHIAMLGIEKVWDERKSMRKNE